MGFDPCVYGWNFGVIKMKTKTKTNKQLLKIWRENEKQTIGGVNAYNDLTLAEKSRLFDLIADGEHLK